jgi:DNA-binding NtrC family response regulator
VCRPLVTGFIWAYPPSDDASSCRSTRLGDKLTKMSQLAYLLIRGESGVGKELVARAVHYSSPRAKNVFVCPRAIRQSRSAKVRKR